MSGKLFFLSLLALVFTLNAATSESEEEADKAAELLSAILSETDSEESSEVRRGLSNIVSDEKLFAYLLNHFHWGSSEEEEEEVDEPKRGLMSKIKDKLRSCSDKTFKKCADRCPGATKKPSFFRRVG